MAKRKTKAQREAEEYAALLQRITDIYSGATGQEWGDGDWATADNLSRVLPAIRELFETEAGDWKFGLHAINYYDTAETAATFLYKNGVRA